MTHITWYDGDRQVADNTIPPIVVAGPPEERPAERKDESELEALALNRYITQRRPYFGQVRPGGAPAVGKPCYIILLPQRLPPCTDISGAPNCTQRLEWGGGKLKRNRKKSNKRKARVGVRSRKRRKSNKGRKSRRKSKRRRKSKKNKKRKSNKRKVRRRRKSRRKRKSNRRRRNSRRLR